MTTGENFIDVDHAQRAKHGQFVAGDVFLCRKMRGESRVLSVLSDGLGSGVKASVLANLTATMAMKYSSAFVDIRQSASTIMETLPICEMRKISYSTFSIIDLDLSGAASIIEHGNPPVLHLRGPRVLPIERTEFTLEAWRDRVISYSEVQLEVGDRLVCFSDGVTQAGLGRANMPLGWGQQRVVDFIGRILRDDEAIASQRLARALVEQAAEQDSGKVKDDITAAVTYFRRPRRLLVITGPPYNPERDGYLAEEAASFSGRKVIAGGTTASIVARQLGRPVEMDLSRLAPDVPPVSRMEGIDLVTEGTLTLARVAEMLERGGVCDSRRPADGAQEMAKLMLESDIIDFLVGTRINEAHQDPNVPVELDLRRNIVRRIAQALESRHLKETRVRFV
jgi:hypothetical protein